MATINPSAISNLVSSYDNLVAFKTVKELRSIINGASISPTRRITRRNSGSEEYARALRERDKTEKKMQDGLIRCARRVTSRIHTGNPANAVQRFSSLLEFTEANINQTGVGKSDTYYSSGQYFDMTSNRLQSVKDRKWTKRVRGMGQKALIQQRRSIYSIHFNLTYNKKKLYRAALLSEYFRGKRAVNDNESDKTDGGGKMVYLPYIVNNTWSRHPSKHHYIWNKHKRKYIKTMTELPRNTATGYMYKIQRVYANWLKNNFPSWNVNVSIGKGFTK